MWLHVALTVTCDFLDEECDLFVESRWHIWRNKWERAGQNPNRIQDIVHQPRKGILHDSPTKYNFIYSDTTQQAICRPFKNVTFLQYLLLLV